MAGLPDALVGAGRMARLDADYAVARATARALTRELRAAEARGGDDPSVADLRARLDRELAQALAVRELLTGVYEDRLATRRAHLDAHAPSVLADQPATEAAAPAPVVEAAVEPEPEQVAESVQDGWDPKTGRNVLTGTHFDSDGFDRAGFHRRTQRDRLGYHRLTGTQLSPSGHLPDGRHYLVRDYGSAAF